MPDAANIKNANSQQDDIDAVTRVLGGDKAAFAFIQKKYKKIIAALIRRMIRNEDDVDDLTQETFIKAYNALGSYQSAYLFSSWLYRIASNSCIDFLRKKRLPAISISQPSVAADDDQSMEIEDRTFMPDIEVLSAERRKAIMDAMAKLPANYREIIKLRHEDELDYSQISEMLGIPMGTVKAHLFRARKLLLSLLKKQKYLFR